MCGNCFRNVWECLDVQTLWAAGVAPWTVKARTPSTPSAWRLGVSVPPPSLSLSPSLPPSLPPLSLLCFRTELCVLSPPAKLPFEESLRQQAAQSMELVISYYCKTRNLHYMADYGWTEILLVLSSIGMNKADLFNCFYAMVAKYIPRHVSLVCQMVGIVHMVSFSLAGIARQMAGHFICFVSCYSTMTQASALSLTL